MTTSTWPFIGRDQAIDRPERVAFLPEAEASPFSTCTRVVPPCPQESCRWGRRLRANAEGAPAGLFRDSIGLTVSTPAGPSRSRRVICRRAGCPSLVRTVLSEDLLVIHGVGLL